LAASPIHAILVLAIIGGWAWLGKFMADHMRAAATPHRARSYAVALLFEWLLFAFVAAGVRRWGAPLLILLGERWHSVREVLANIGIAAAFWLVSLGLLFILGRLLRIRSSSQDMRFILPHGGAEIALWIALSVTAGICEEAIFRGYLQRQFMAFTGSAAAGILISAAAFGWPTFTRVTGWGF
jgi:membrane protease YdiL (CAAX protease family)